jgi:tRNA(fMet)-specific endonuclease VapC
MNFLLDTDICSAHMRRPVRLADRVIQYNGQLSLASVNLAELSAGAYKHSQATRLLSLISGLLEELEVIDFDAACARKFGEVRGTLLRQGISVPTADLMIATTALV